MQNQEHVATYNTFWCNGSHFRLYQLLGQLFTARKPWIWHSIFIALSFDILQKRNHQKKRMTSTPLPLTMKPLRRRWKKQTKERRRTRNRWQKQKAALKEERRQEKLVSLSVDLTINAKLNWRVIIWAHPASQTSRNFDTALDGLCASPTNHFHMM